MKMVTFPVRVCLLCVLTLSSAILSSCTTTQQPALACVGDDVTVSCDLSVPDPNDSFLSLRTDFLVGTSVGLSPGTVNGDTTAGGVDLSRLTADAPVGTLKNVQGTLTLLSYTLADNGLLLGCSNEHNINGDNSNTNFLVETVNLAQAVPPSSFVVTLSQPDISCSTILTWSLPVSERPITSYSVYRDSISIANVSGTTTEYTDSDVTGVYKYSVVAISCAGNFTSNTVSSVSIGVPSSPLVTLSLSSNTLISWSTPSSDRPITSYSVYRNNTFLTNTADNHFTDNTQLNINTVYEYSVVAISCAGTSTAGVKSISIGSTSLATSSPLTISYDDTTNELFVDWTLNQPTQPITVTYNLGLVYSYTQLDITYPYVETEIFSQISDDTNYTLSLRTPTIISNGPVVLIITVNLRITQQSNIPFYDGIVLTATTESTFTSIQPIPHFALSTGAIIVICVGVCICCCCLPILTVILLSVIIYTCIVRNRKNKADKRSIHLYEDMNETHTGEYVDMNRMNITAVRQSTESQHYTHMSPLDKKQLPPNYENMNKF